MDADSGSGCFDGECGRVRQRRIQQGDSQRFALRLGREQCAVGWIVPLARLWKSGKAPATWTVAGVTVAFLIERLSEIEPFPPLGQLDLEVSL